MASRIASRYVFRRFSSNGKILSEEEKAAENVYIKKIEKEKLEKLARKGPQTDANTSSSSTGAATDSKANTSTASSSTEKVSTDKYRNYAVVAGTITIISALGWYLKSGGEKKQVRE